jgi:hypothetical protein
VTLDQSAAAGLDRAAVRARVAAGQVNTAPPGQGRTVGQILRANVLTRFNAIPGQLFVVVGPPDHHQHADHRGAGILPRGAPLARPGFTRRVLAFTVPAGTAAAVAGLAYAIALSTPGVGTVAARTAATLAVFAVGLWVLALIAGLPALMRIALVLSAMACALVLLLAVPLARRVALQLPPASVCV